MPMGGLTPPSYSICCAAATHQALLVGCDFFLPAKKTTFTCQGRDRDAKGEKEGEKAKVGFGVGNPSNLLLVLLVVGMVVGWTFCCSSVDSNQDGAFAVLVNYESTSFPLLGDMQYLDSSHQGNMTVILVGRLGLARARDLLLLRLLLFQVHHANESGCTLVAMVGCLTVWRSFES